MADHLRYSGRDAAVQRQVLVDVIADDPVLMRLLRGMSELGLPDPLLGSGAIYNTLWNVLTGRDRHAGIKDADVVYFDSTDRSYEAEDRVIRRTQAYFADSPIPVEVRNQARVHLWFPEKFGLAYPMLNCSADMLRYFATKTHAVAARIEKGEIVIFAPFGLDDLFSFRLTPNPVLDNRATHESKAARAMALWPELRLEGWPE
ncbi:MAG TPA: nucleotidyltransferase family protein [Devosia sp.]|nr:nucleotidyltransferase family protein [Devosia sp.]